jgi:hypothetical protein
MKLKYILPILSLSLLLAGCGPQKTVTPDAKKTQPLTTKILINELPLKDRPFTVLVPHSTNRLFTFVAKNADKAKTAGLDLEYISGDLLKGASAAIATPIPPTYVKGIILGSCSTGGKCTFDKDLKSGTMKFKLTFEGQDAINMLKGDFTFVTGQTNLPDGKVTFTPAKTSLKDNLILMNSFGLPLAITKEILLYPVVISATSDKQIVGTLTINQAGVTAAEIFDGTAYVPLKIADNNGVITAAINHKPWSMSAEITRDDEKGNKESLNLYLLGPIILNK